MSKIGKKHPIQEFLHRHEYNQGSDVLYALTVKKPAQTDDLEPRTAGRPSSSFCSMLSPGRMVKRES